MPTPPFVMKAIVNLTSLYNLMNEHQEIVLCPVGIEGDNLLELLRYANLMHTERICCIIAPNLLNANLQQFRHSVPVMFPEDLPHMRETAAFIIAAPPQQREPIYLALTQFGCKNVFLINDDVQSEINNNLQNIWRSGQHLMWFMNYFYDKMTDLKYRLEEQGELCAVNSRTFEPFRNKFRGKKVVIVATGPSLEKYKPIPDAIHIGLNFAWKNENIPLDYLFINDGYGKEIRDKLEVGFDRIAHGIFISKLPDRFLHSYITYPEDASLRWKNVHRFYVEDYSDYPIYQDICYHPLTTNASVCFAALHFALFTYPKEIYLVGCDASSKYVHFYDHSQPNPIDFPGLGRIKVTWARMKVHARRHYPETEIISINPVGLKGLFRDMYTDEQVVTPPVNL